MKAERNKRLVKSTRRLAPVDRRAAYLMIEALVFIAVLFVVLGVGYAALYRCIDHSTVLRRNADDIARALQAGERWRADARACGQSIVAEDSAEGQIVHLQGPQGQVDYRFADGSLYRRSGDHPWVRVLDRVRSSSMRSDLVLSVPACRWELELQPQARGSVKASRIRPLFTFLAVPATPP